MQASQRMTSLAHITLTALKLFHTVEAHLLPSLKVTSSLPFPKLNICSPLWISSSPTACLPYSLVSYPCKTVDSPQICLPSTYKCTVSWSRSAAQQWYAALYPQIPYHSPRLWIPPSRPTHLAHNAHPGRPQEWLKCERPGLTFGILASALLSLDCLGMNQYKKRSLSLSVPFN